jgi:hypothetical protein
MKIGFIRQEKMAIKTENGTKEVKWLECHMRIAGLRAFNLKMLAYDKKDQSKKEPDYTLLLRSNVNKGDKFRDIPIGALWIGSAIIDGVEKKFMTGYIESIALPLGRVNIAVWKAEPLWEGDNPQYLYDIKTMEDRQAQTPTNDDVPTYDMPQQDHNTPNITIDEDEIPF